MIVGPISHQAAPGFEFEPRDIDHGTDLFAFCGLLASPIDTPIPEPYAAAPMPPATTHRERLKTVCALALWPVLENALRWTVEATDTFVAGHQPHALAAADAVGVTTYIDWFMGLMHSAVGVGVTALVARAVGAGHRGSARAALGQGLLLGVIAGVLSGLAGLALSYGMGPAFGLSEEAAGLAAVYLRILAFSMPFSAILAVACAAMRGAGDMRTPLLLMLGLNAVNTLCTVLLAGVTLPSGQKIGLGWGVSGIAAGTAIAYGAGAVMALIALRFEWTPVRLIWHRLRPHGATLHRILRVSLPVAMEFAGMMAANYLLLRIVSQVPEAGALGAHIIVLRVESLCFLPGLGMAAAAATLVGQALGRHAPDEARRLGWLCAGLTVGIMGLLALPIALFANHFAHLFSNEPAHLLTVPACIVVAALAQPLFGLQLTLGGALRGAGDTRPIALFNALTLLGLRLPLAWILGLTWSFGLLGVWTAMMLELGLRGAFAAFWFWRGGWARVRV